MKYADFTRRIAGEGAAAWDIHYQALAAQARGEDVIVLSVGDPDFDTPAPITNAAIASLQAGHTHYADCRGDEELRTIIANYHSNNSGQPVNADQVTVVAGAQCALFATAMCLFDPGDEVIIPEPTYVTYEAVFSAPDAKIVNVPMRPEDNFHLRMEDIEMAISAKTKAIVINSPHNPTGASVSRGQWQEIARLCIQHDLWLIVDEVYETLIFEGEHFNPCCLDGMGERTITISSLSKSHAMTGWRLGWVIASEELSAHLCNLALCMLYGSPSFIQDAAKVALTQPMDEIQTMFADYKKRRDTFYAALSAIPGIHCYLPEGGMFVMIDIRQCGVSANEFSRTLYEQHGVSVLAGEAFGPSAHGHIRCSLAIPEAELLRAAQRIAACVADFQGR